MPDQAYLSANDIADLLGRHRPTEDQRAIIEAPLTSMLVIAGAGSGKTETMSARVVWLIANNMVAPSEVLGLTFTRKAAGELSERVRDRLAALARAQAGDRTDAGVLGALDRPTISTYNSYAAALVSDHGLRIGREPGARMLSEASAWAMVSQIVERWGQDIDTDAALSSVTEAVLKLTGALNEHLLTVEEAKAGFLTLLEPLEDLAVSKRTPNAEVQRLGRSLSTRYQILDLVAEYQLVNKNEQALDFGDQVALAAQLALEAPAVGELERERFKVVLLDEYQDTSYAQIKLLTALFGAGHPVTAVGDPNQSIYGWRGASASGPARFPSQFRNADGSRAKVFQLATSWRNDLAILDAANFTARPLYDNDPANSLPALGARPGAGVGAVSAGYFETASDESEHIVAYLQANWRPGQSTAAILCRARSQFPVIEAALRVAGIPVEVVGLGGLLMTPEVVDLVALLEVIYDPARGDSLMRLLTGPRFNFGASDLAALGAFSRMLARRPRRDEPGVQADSSDERSIIDALVDLPGASWHNPNGPDFSEQGRRRLGQLAGKLSSLRSLTYLPLAELIEAGERVLGLDIEMALVADRAVRGGAPRDLANPWGRAHLDAFRKIALQFAQSVPNASLGGFLGWLDDAQDRERGLEKPLGATDPNAVQLITVHASKGLEWDVVVVPGMADGVFPSITSASDKGPSNSGWLTSLEELPFPLRGDAADLPQLDYAQAQSDGDFLAAMTEFKAICGAHMVLEERRLAYVAFTRARAKLLVTGAWWRTAKKPTTPSPFLAELVEQGIISDVTIMPEPEPGAENPSLGAAESTTWPRELDPDQESVELGGDMRAQDEHARALVEIRRAGDLVTKYRAHSGVPARSPRVESTGGADLVELAELLVTERDRLRQVSTEIEFPGHISVSGLVQISRDRGAYALARRRPVPQEPSVASRRGTTFHLWVEQFYGRTTLFDIDDLPGSDDLHVDADQTLEQLQRTFESSQWAQLTPIELEADIDVVMAGAVVRSRIDAVFADPQVPYDGTGPRPVVVVDWKTGRAPTDPAEQASRELQLAVYRLAWSLWSGTPLERVSAAFYYVTSDDTVRPASLASRAQIEALMRGGS